MEKPVIISIRGVQGLVGTDEKDKMELVTQGVLKQDGETISFTYLESELTGLEGTVTTFEIGKDAIILTREGTVNSRMVFQEGKRNVSIYETPYGGLLLGVSTQYAHAALTDAGGELTIRYALDVDNEPVGKNFFEIRVNEPGARPAQ